MDQTSNQADNGQSLTDVITGAGSTAGTAAGSALQQSAPGIGAGLVSGALGQLSDTIGPYALYIVLGFAALLLIRR